MSDGIRWNPFRPCNCSHCFGDIFYAWVKPATDQFNLEQKRNKMKDLWYPFISVLKNSHITESYKNTWFFLTRGVLWGCQQQWWFLPPYFPFHWTSNSDSIEKNKLNVFLSLVFLHVRCDVNCVVTTAGKCLRFLCLCCYVFVKPSSSKCWRPIFLGEFSLAEVLIWGHAIKKKKVILEHSPQKRPWYVNITLRYR